ncbi:MAG: di-trans,poly-cis-decaprenylcistransferase, partial [Alphaproteobacteria bacterium]|nr:di-trans,poly-cis-decaprenylcistransferase [Alphaproteobacteria bacterium]
IGERSGIDPELLRLIEETERLTQFNTELNLVIAFNYGGRQEISQAARKLAEEVRAGALHPAEITPERFAVALSTSDLPDPELLIRTSGEQRLSNFLLWQLAYAEFVFLEVNWPDFSKVHLADAISKFTLRERRFGGLTERSSA